MSRFLVRKVAVLGAGVMGAQIAAHLVNVGVPVLLFDLPAKEGPKSGVAQKAVDALKKLRPAPIGVPEDAGLISAVNYDDNLPQLAECDLIIEAIAERMDWKLALYERIAPHVAPHAIVASNTSGLSITKLSEALPQSMRTRFCGIHFFNPPRYMALVELIPTPATDPAIVDALESFATTTLGKGVVRAKDTPNFIANRVGIAGMLATMIEAEKFGLSVDLVDDLTGKKLGRASSGTFRTADVVGLDTMAHVIKTLQDTLGPSADRPEDPFYPSYTTPAVLSGLIQQGALGQKSGAGFYKKVGKDILRLDPKAGTYVPSGTQADPLVDRILKKPPAERLKLLHDSTNPQAQFLWALLRDNFHYAATHLASIADNARDVDLAMRWGFGMQMGPFELWQAAGWKAVAEWVQADIAAGKGLSNAPLPSWVFDSPVAERGGVHQPEGSWSASAQRFVPVRDLPVYKRQYFPDSVLGSHAADAATAGTTVYEDEAIRLWTLPDADASNVLILSIKTKVHAISPAVVDGLVRGVTLAEEQYQGLVIWARDEPFSYGADLQALLPVFMAGGVKAIEPVAKALQDAVMRIRYAQVPVVAAIRGMALGGGCELIVQCARRVAAMESYIGLVEAGIGLLPGGGGLTYIARRAAERAAEVNALPQLLTFLKDGYTAAAMAKAGTSAIECRQLGYLRDGDVIVPHKDELLHVAITQVQALADSGYRPPMRKPFPVAGRSAKATLMAQLVNMRDGGFISEHDMHIATLIADVVCGGDVDAGVLVDEGYLMTLERRHFMTLLQHPKTQERIMSMLNGGKPIRN